jgi:hypothetical protein
MASYLFNVMNTYEIEASSEDKARDLLGTDKAILRDSDTLLVEVK